MHYFYYSLSRATVKNQKNVFSRGGGMVGYKIKMSNNLNGDCN